MNQTSKNTILTVVGVIVVIAIITFAMKGMTDTENGLNATNTPAGTASGVQGSGQPSSVTTVTTVNQNGTVVPSGSAAPSNAYITQMMNIAKMRVPATGVDVALSNGKATFVDGSITGTVSLGALLGVVTTTDGYDAYAPVTITTRTVANNQTNTNNYLALFHVKGQSVVHSSSVIIGSNVIIQDIEARDNKQVKVSDANVAMDSSAGYLVKVTYLDRKSGEIITVTPTVSKELSASVKNHIITR